MPYFILLYAQATGVGPLLFRFTYTYESANDVIVPYIIQYNAIKVSPDY